MSDKPGEGSRLIPSERLKRVLGFPGHGGSLSPGAKTTIFFGVVALLAAFAAWLDPRPSLRHVTQGSSRVAKPETITRSSTSLRSGLAPKGQIPNLASAGSAENVQRLIAGRKRCDFHFALVQDGIPVPTTKDSGSSGACLIPNR